MKKCFILIHVLILTACTNIAQKQQETEQQNEIYTANLATEAVSNKSLKNAFKVFEQIDELTTVCKTGEYHDSPELHCNDDYFGICDDWMNNMTRSEFYVLFGKMCNYNPNCYDGVREHNTTRSKKFEIIKKYFLTKDMSTRDKAMLQKCLYLYKGNWWDNETDDCSDFWSEYKARKTEDKCLFDYKIYLPNNIKISSYKNFVKLYVAYKESMFECDTKSIKTGNFVCDKLKDGSEKCYEKEHKLTGEEKQQCYDEVEKKLNALAKSGDL